MTSAGEQVLLLTGLTEAQAPTDTVAAMLAVYGITDPKEFARKIQPELKKLDALAR